MLFLIVFLVLALTDKLEGDMATGLGLSALVELFMELMIIAQWLCP